MRRRWVLVLVAGAAVVLAAGPLAVPGAAVAQAAAGSWGRAIAVPGLSALNKGGNANVSSVSCGSAGSCAAGGYYRDGHGRRQGFVVSEKQGRWGRAIEVPGLGTLSKGDAGVRMVSCASAGNCAAVGAYRDQSRHFQGFVVSEKQGRWGRAVEVRGLGALNSGGNAVVNSVSCGLAGNCTAGGAYTDGDDHPQGFVAVEQNGAWRQAIEVPGLAILNQGGNAAVRSVSCASAGNCAAVGDYTSGASGGLQAFVVSEMGGSWGTAQEVAGNLSTGQSYGAFLVTVSCGSAGNCAAGGTYDGPGNDMFVISEVNGTWASAQKVAGNLYAPGGGTVDSVSCASAGNCSAGGTYDYGGYDAAFLVSEKNGTWGRGISVPGFRDAFLTAVSCASAGNCAAGGSYDGDGSGVFVVIEVNGIWGKETTVRGLGGLINISSVSCAPAGSCVAGGSYQGSSRSYVPQGFVT